MAINPNFVFTDPVAAQQAVQLFQLEQAAADAMRRNAQENIRTFGQQNIARENAAQQRAITESQLAQRERESQALRAQREADLLEDRRQFDISDATRNKQLTESRALREADLDLRRQETQRMEAENAELESMAALEAQIQRGNPPTENEFALQTATMTPRRKAALNQLRLDAISELNRNADMAEKIAARWQARLDQAKTLGGASVDAVIAEFEKSKDKNYVDVDPASGRFMSLLRRPRTDPVQGPEEAPSGAPTVSALQQRLQDSRNRIRSLLGEPVAAPAAPTERPPMSFVPLRGF